MRYAIYRQLCRLDILKILFFILGTILVTVSCLPLFRSGFFVLHDSLHVDRLFTIDQSIRQGIFPVRWSTDFGYGYGMPLFNFYAPLPYYLGEILVLAGFSYLNAIKLIFALTAIVTFAAMYLLAKELWGQWGGIISATAYLYLPYRLLDFFIRGTLGELWVMALWPLAAWAGIKIIRSKSPDRYFFIYTLCLSAIFLSHNIFGLLTLAGGVLIMVKLMIDRLINRQSYSSKLWRLVFGLIVSIGISAFFTIPAWLEKKHTIVDRFATTGYWDFRQHFLYFRQLIIPSWGYGESVAGIGDTLSFQIGSVHLFLLTGSVIAYLRFRKKNNSRMDWGIITYIALIFLVFLTNYKSQFVWETFTILRFMQFPWRLVAVIGFLISLLAGSLVLILEKKQHRTLFGLIMSFVLVAVNYAYLHPAGYIPASSLAVNSQKIKTGTSLLLIDYLPKTAKADQSGQPIVSVLGGEATISDLVKRENSVQFGIDNQGQEARIQVTVFDFPGWQVFLNGRIISHTFSKEGWIVFAIPVGLNQIKVSFTNTPVRSIANTISIVSILFLGWFMIKENKLQLKK